MYAEWALTMCWNDISNPQPQTAEVQNLCMPEMLKRVELLYISGKLTNLPTSANRGFSICLKLNEALKDL